MGYDPKIPTPPPPITKEFDLKMWICVSNNFDVKKVIADMLSTLKKERPHLDDTLDALQNILQTEIMSKKFLLILDDIWEEEENFVLQVIEVAMMIARVIEKKEIFRLEGLEEDQCLQILNSCIC
ncbi:hypothetical protein M5K25_009776 [Dendrobium thyrsiflorum]|uniref:NB-ARC domain-containing protein n=1 Tax=Dendrobium thyrsiflorum TaxID=117978 RepID=A0ABD0V6Q2_DENTH